MAESTCQEPGCSKPVKARLLCDKHYDVWRLGQPDREGCAEDGCVRPARSRGLCATHHRYRVRHGLPMPVPRYDKAPAIERFATRIEVVGRCWIWTGRLDDDGYGVFFDRLTKRKKVSAHRWSYEHFREPIPAGLQIDHLCRVRACVNPNHLATVTIARNVRRGDLPRLNRWAGYRPMEAA